jgi:hypothetical protein
MPVEEQSKGSGDRKRQDGNFSTGLIGKEHFYFPFFIHILFCSVILREPFYKEVFLFANILYLSFSSEEMQGLLERTIKYFAKHVCVYQKLL